MMFSFSRGIIRAFRPSATLVSDVRTAAGISRSSDSAVLAQTPKAADRDIGMVLLILRAPSVPGLLEGLIAMAMMTAITSGAHSIEPGRSLRAQKLQIASLHLRASEMRAIRRL
jgi:hypothetical protein